MRFPSIFLILPLLTFVRSAQAGDSNPTLTQAPTQFIQVKCTMEGKTVIVGNNTSETLAQTDVLNYRVNGDDVQLLDRYTETLSFKQTSAMNGQLSVASPSIALEVSVYKHPLAWNAGTINGKEARCLIDSVYFQSLSWSN